MSNNQTYTVEANMPDLRYELTQLFERAGYEVKPALETSGSGFTLRASKLALGLPRWTGAESKLSVEVLTGDRATHVKLTDQMWFDKIVVSSVALLLSWLVVPVFLLVPAGLASYAQYKDAAAVWEAIDVHMVDHETD